MLKQIGGLCVLLFATHAYGAPLFLSNASYEAVRNWISSNTLEANEKYPDFLRAAANTNTRVVRLLLRKGANPSARSSAGWTMLHMVARENQNPQIAQILVQAGALVDTRNRKGETPLHTAVRWNSNTRMVENLLKNGANPNAKSFGGDTPLHTAAHYGQNTWVFYYLLTHGADLSAKDALGRTALDILRQRSDKTRFILIDYLLASGAHP